jgi:hypothetical protein
MKPTVIVRSDKYRDGAPVIELYGPPFASGVELSTRELHRLGLWLQGSAKAADRMPTKEANWRDQMFELPHGLQPMYRPKGSKTKTEGKGA